MPRSACIRHPRDKVIEIPIGAKYCERCRHLVLPEPELEIVEIVQEMTLEEESAPSVEEYTEEAVEAASRAAIAVLDKSIETPVEAKPKVSVTVLAEGEGEPKPGIIEVPVETAELLDSEHEDIHDSMDQDVIEREARKAEITRLKALLAKLEPETE